MNKGDLAVQYKRGMNCCQAVLCAFKDELHSDETTLRRLGANFGAGMGTMGATCGALVGAQMVMGLMGNQRARLVYAEFERRCGSTICKELKGVETGKMLCPCDECVRRAAQIVAEQLAPI